MPSFYFEKADFGKKILSYKDKNDLFHGPYLVQKGNTLTLVFYKHGALIGPYLNYVFGDRINYSITISTKVRESFDEFYGYGPTLVVSNSGVNCCGYETDSIYDPDDLWVLFEWNPEIKVSYSQVDEESIYHDTDLENVLFPFLRQLKALNTLVLSAEMDDEYFEYKDFYIPLKMHNQTCGTGFFSQKRNNGLFVSYGSLDYERSAFFTGFKVSTRFSAFMTSKDDPGFIFQNQMAGVVVKDNTITLKCKLNPESEDIIDLIKLSSNSLYCYSDKKEYSYFNFFDNVSKHKIK